MQEVSDDRTGDDPTDALRAMDRLVEAGFTTFQLGNSLGGGRELAEKRVGAYLKSVREREGERATEKGILAVVIRDSCRRMSSLPRTGLKENLVL